MTRSDRAHTGRESKNKKASSHVTAVFEEDEAQQSESETVEWMSASNSLTRMQLDISVHI